MNHLGRLFIAALLAATTAANAAEVARFVEYIESDGTGSAAGEYVMLDYKPTAQSVVEMDVTPLDLSFNSAFFCARGAYDYYGTFTLFNVAGHGLRWDYNRTTEQYEAGIVAGVRQTIRAAPDGLWIDGVKSTTISVSPANYTPANKMVLFASYRTSINAVPSNMQNAGNWAKMRLYSFKAWDDSGETLRVHLRPCVDTDGVACLYDVVNDHLYYNIKSGKAFAPSASWSPDCLVVSAAPVQYAAPSPNGLTANLAANAVVPVSCPAVWTNEAGTAAATCTGWKLYDDAGTVISQGPETSFDYIHPGAARRLEWQWAVEYRVDASSTGGGTAAPASQWVASGATATVTATPSATHTFHHWAGDVPAGANAQAATFSFAATAPAALQAVFSKTASSGTRTWIGGASGEWAVAANWDPEGVPAANDTIVFAESAAVSPPASFVGTISVSAGATVAAAYASAASFTLAVADGGRFEKHGAGEVTIYPADADNQGTVAVCEGTAVFAGNGVENEPGIFGPLEVAPGATARVVESPFEMRHAVITYAKFDARAEATKTAEFNTYAKLQAKWAEFMAEPSASWKVFVPSGVSRPFLMSVNDYLPGAIAVGTNKNFAFISKATLVIPTPKTRHWLRSDGYGSSYFYLGTAGTATGLDSTSMLTRRAGWTPFAIGFGSNNSAVSGLLSVRLDNEAPATLANVLSHGNLWNGVCFGGLTLPQGATLRVADGQAVGFAFPDAPAIAGSVVAEGSGACFSIMLAHAPVDLLPLNGFAGRIELGVHGRAYASAALAAPAFSLLGDGEIGITADGVAETIAYGFSGTIRVPAGRSFTSTTSLGSGVLFTGEGTVVAEQGAPRPPADFEGSLVLDGAQSLDATGAELAYLSGLTLGAGSALTLGAANAAIPRGVYRDIPALDEAGAWTLAGSATAGADGRVSLTTAASQSAAVWLPSYAMLPDDAWQVKFTYSAAETAAGAVRGDGFAFLLRADWGIIPCLHGALYSNKTRDYFCNTSGGDTTCFGFAFRHNTGGRNGLDWVFKGYPANGEGATFDMLSDFDMLQPIDFTVSFAKNAMNVRLEQGGHTATFRRAFTSLYPSAVRQPRHLGFAASTDTAAKGSLVQSLSNVSGWYRTESYAAETLAGDDYAVSAANWVPFKNASFANDYASLLLCAEPATSGWAVCRAPIPRNRAFRLSCRVVLEELNDAYTHSCFATMLHNLGLGIGELNPVNAATSGNLKDGYALPSVANSVSSFFQSYNASSQSTLGFRTAHKTFVGNTATTMCRSTPTQTYDYALSSDGLLGLAARLSYGGSDIGIANQTTSGLFSQLGSNAIGDDIYLMLAGYNGYYSSTKCAQRMRVDNLSVVFPLNHDAVYGTPIAFEGDATLVVGNAETNASTAVASFPSVTLAAGATLTVASETSANPALAGLGVALDAPASLATDVGAVVRLDTVAVSAASPATLTLSGDFMLGPDGLTVVVSGGRQLRKGFTLLDIADATFAGGIDASRIHFVDEEGHPLDSFVAVVRGGDVRVQFRGGTMVLLQ